MKSKIKVLAINPGSTSTKIALFEDERKLFELSVSHDSQTIAKSVAEQLPERMELVEKATREAGFALEEIEAFSGRGGGGINCEGGVYTVNERFLADARSGRDATHPANLGSQIADAFAKRYGGKAFIVNPPSADELELTSRITGLRDIFRMSHLHALNQKEIGIRYAASVGKCYEELNLVIAHIGGGISITAHRKGRMVDSSSNIKGEGPLAPTRVGTVPAVPLIEMCYSGKYTKEEMLRRMTRDGGWTEHLGTPDAREVSRRIEAGDAYAKLVYDAMIQQLAKEIGAYTTVLYGKVDAILLTGGLMKDEGIVRELNQRIAFLAPVVVYPGEFELEALAAGALRVLRGEEQAKEYTGVPVWEPKMLETLPRYRKD